MKELLMLFIESNGELIKDTIALGTQTLSNEINWWMWISILELTIILFLLFKKNNGIKNNEKRKLKKEVLIDDIDFDNTLESIFTSDKLYDELKVKCHPDRFPNNENLQKIADNLFQQISENKNNSKVLLELKEEAKKKLNINFKN